MACEEVREGEDAGSRGYGDPQVWVLTATPGEATLSPSTRGREIENRECETYTRGFHSMHTRVRSYSWSGELYSYSTALIRQALVLTTKNCSDRAQNHRGRSLIQSVSLATAVIVSEGHSE